MAEDYTPTTETVREVYAVWRYDEGVLGERDAAAEFDAWLAAHDRQVAERVLRDAAEFERRGRTHLAAAVRAHSAAPARPTTDDRRWADKVANGCAEAARAALAARPAPTVSAADVDERAESLRELATGEWTIRAYAAEDAR